MPRITRLEQKTVIDIEGEIKEQETAVTYDMGKEPNFIKLYLDNILYVSNLPKGLNKILSALLMAMGYDNTVYINASMKRDMAKMLGLSVESINKAITSFVKGQILFREDTGKYVVNPHLFGKGEWKNVSKIRMSIDFTPDGKFVSTQIEKDDEKPRFDVYQGGKE